ncbi:hypothetical protein HPB47_024439 [Ixodes persulcatus]|uniref:Uncharacterized protein n=1 Tax=Ixodes persulcatus TaxID=34615 RepID=A0AC60Q495_IXOPE|nr:hypothetical protein HPB47_024439 [Ixodes persulcatus]
MWSSPSPKPAELHDPAAGELDPDDFLPDCQSSITVTEDDLEDAMACLSPFQRTLERIINKKVLHHLESNNLLSNAQHGFRPGRSCETALCTVVHTSFIEGRTQRVVFGGEKSPSSTVLSGVPQGSVLGPTLFLIYIDDIAKVSNSTPIMYADDLSLLQPIRSDNSYQALQDDLDQCFRWSAENKLPFNCSKSVAMTFAISSKTSKTTSQASSLTLGGSLLKHVPSTTLLGVVLDSRLNFAPQVHSATSKARRMLGFVTRVTRGMTPNTFRHLYTALVLPHLEYCSAVWYPQQKYLQATLQGVQRRAAYTYYRRSVSPPSVPLPYREVPSGDLLKAAAWRSLHQRQQVASVRLFCRIMGPKQQEFYDAPRMNKRTGRLQPVMSRTLRHGEPCLLRAATL